MGTPSFDFGYKTLGQIVERINSANGIGLDEHTPEYLAAAYVAQAQEEAGYELCEDSAMEHFEVLRVSGAEFDVINALSLLNL